MLSLPGGSFSIIFFCSNDQWHYPGVWLLPSLGADGGCGEGDDYMPGGGRGFWWDISFLFANQNKNQNIFIDRNLLKLYMLYMLTLLK